MLLCGLCPLTCYVLLICEHVFATNLALKFYLNVDGTDFIVGTKIYVTFLSFQ